MKPREPLGRSKALDDALGITWPDFTEREFEWTERMKKLLRAYLTKKGIHFHQTRDRLINEAIDNAQKGGYWGNKRRVISEFKRIYRQYHNEVLEAQDKKQTPKVAMLLKERALNHPELFNPDGTERGFYETGFVPNTTGIPQSQEAFMKSQRQTAAPVQGAATEHNEQETTVTDLNDKLTKTADEQAAQDTPQGITDAMINEHELDPKQIRHAIPGHLDKTYGKGKGGLHVRHIFGAKGFDTWYSEHKDDSILAWRLVLQYELKNPPLPELNDDEKEAEQNNAKQAPPSVQTQPTATTPIEAETPAKASVASVAKQIEIEVVVPPKQEIAIIDQPTIEIIQFDPNRALEAVKGKVALLNRIIKEILVDGVDYGNVPGSDKKCLYKPGAEKLLVGFDIYDRCVPTANTAVDWKAPFFNFEYECTIYNRATGRIEGTGIGSCNSMESKYRWRDSKRQCPHCKQTAIIKGKDEYGGGWLCFKKQGGCGATFKDGDKSIETQVIGRIENPDICDIVNTISKMAQKRALVAATLNATAASSVFTQDLDDLKDFGVFDIAA